MATYYSGGDLKEATCNHPSLGLSSYDPYGGEDSTYSIGSNTSDDDDTKATASGGFIDSMSTKRDTFSCCFAGSPGDGKYEKLIAHRANTQLGVWTFTNTNGRVYRLTGKPVGDISMSGKDSKIEVKFAGTLRVI